MAVQAAVELCIVQIKRYLSSEQLPTAAFNESAERGFHAAETFVQVQILVLNQTSGRKLNSTLEGGGGGDSVSMGKGKYREFQF